MRGIPPSNDELLSTCKNGGMFHSLGPTVADVLKRHSIRRLFILSHSKIQRRVEKMLAKVELLCICMAAACISDCLDLSYDKVLIILSLSYT